MEAVLAETRGLMTDAEAWRIGIKVFEVRVTRVHVYPSIVMDGTPNRIDPDKWSPLIMNFQKFYGLAPGQVHSSRLGEIPESTYLSPDVERAREAARAG